MYWSLPQLEACLDFLNQRAHFHPSIKDVAPITATITTSLHKLIVTVLSSIEYEVLREN